MRGVINSSYLPSFSGRMTDYSDGRIIDTPASCEVRVGPRETPQHALDGHAMAHHCYCKGGAGYIASHQLFRRPTQVTGTQAVRNASYQWFQVVFGSNFRLVPILGLRNVHVFQRVHLQKQIL